MIGYYVHHHGRGHRQRAGALARALGDRADEVTGLSSLERPARWPGEWVRLPLDREPAEPDAGLDASRRVTAGGRLHWAPLAHDGLRRRTAIVSAWIEEHRPAAVVVDVSVEMVLLARLHGVPVVSVVLPGRRDDAAHRLGFDVADALVAFWPDTASGMLRGVPDEVARRVRPLGALSRFAAFEEPAPEPVVGARRRVVLMTGTGGHTIDAAALERARHQTPAWDWSVVGPLGRWVEDPSALVAGSDAVVTHAGQNALAEVAAARRPALVVPQDRPFAEQRTTASVLAAGPWPVRVEPTFPEDDWARRLDQVAALDGSTWRGWCDGGAVGRFADVVLETAAVGRERGRA